MFMQNFLLKNVFSFTKLSTGTVLYGRECMAMTARIQCNFWTRYCTGFSNIFRGFCLLAVNRAGHDHQFCANMAVGAKTWCKYAPIWKQQLQNKVFKRYYFYFKFVSTFIRHQVQTAKVDGATINVPFLYINYTVYSVQYTCESHVY